MEKGTKENPYSYDEYLELAKTNEWKGGYVRLDDGIVKWEPREALDVEAEQGREKDREAALAVEATTNRNLWFVAGI